MPERKREIGEPDRSRPQIRAGRLTQTRTSALASFPYPFVGRRQWDRMDVRKFENSCLSAAQLLSILPDVSSDVGLATWNVNRLASSGFRFTVKDDAGQDDEQAKALLDQIVPLINQHYGGLEALIVQWLMSGYLQGAVCGEIALKEGLKDVEDFYPVDPTTIDFKLDEEKKLQPYQDPPMGGVPIALNPETFFYYPLDPWIDDPYGRSPAAPVLQEVWFDIQIMNGLRKIVRNQGWPRNDISIDQQAVYESAPTSVKGDPVKLVKYQEMLLDATLEAYNNLKEDDAYGHMSTVTVEQKAVGAKLPDVSSVMDVVERRMIKALKQLPILMGNNEGSTETHGTVQWLIYVSGLESVQKPVCWILQKMFTVALNAAGMTGIVQCEFEKLATSDKMKDAQAEQMQIQNAYNKWLYGWQTWEESAIEATGSAPPEGATEPDRSLFAGNGQNSQNSDPNADPNTNNSGRQRKPLDWGGRHSCSNHSEECNRDRLDEELDAWMGLDESFVLDDDEAA